MNDVRPISLCNVIYKMIFKAVTTDQQAKTGSWKFNLRSDALEVAKAIKWGRRVDHWVSDCGHSYIANSFDRIEFKYISREMNDSSTNYLA